ncbi:MAG: LrgB family protein [Veillonellaceae bacterium]|nr:LrgB family protein [Veillonellaceae bacterium]
MSDLLLSIFGTLLIYYLVKALYRRTGQLWLMPLIMCPVVIVAVLMFLRIPYTDYATGGFFLQWLLGPATVAFAVPLYRQRHLVRRYLPELGFGSLVAAVTAMATTMTVIRLFGADPLYILSLAPRSITTPLAMNISTMLGGNMTITAVFVIVTGVLGMLLTVTIIRFLNINNPLLKGLLFGFSAHGTGTAKAYEDSEKVGVIASVAMIFIGIMTALTAPFLIPFLLSLLTR